MVIAPDCKKILPLAVSVCPFETLRSDKYIYINRLYILIALRPGFILMAVFTFQVVVFQRDYGGSR